MKLQCFGNHLRTAPSENSACTPAYIDVASVNNLTYEHTPASGNVETPVSLTNNSATRRNQNKNF